MMHDMMSGMGWGIGLAGLLGIVVLVLAIASLVKYVFFRWGPKRSRDRTKAQPRQRRPSWQPSFTCPVAC